MSDARKKEIIMATLELAANKGLGNVSMNMIADKVGIKKPFWIPTNHRLVKIKFHKPLLNGVHEAEPDTWIFHLFYN